MKIEKGMKCRYVDNFGFECDGEVLSVSENGFTCWQPSKCPAQYNDSVRQFTLEDVGKTVFFEKG